MRVKASIILSTLLALASCSPAADKETEQGEAAAAGVEAAIMQGRTAARAFINMDPADTMAIQAKLLEARAAQSKYIIAGKRDHAEAFDTAFLRTLKAVSPDVANAVETAQSN